MSLRAKAAFARPWAHARPKHRDLHPAPPLGPIGHTIAMVAGSPEPFGFLDVSRPAFVAALVVGVERWRLSPGARV